MKPMQQVSGNNPSLPSTAPNKPFKLPEESQLDASKSTFWKLIYNKDTGEYCGRTCLSWFLIVSYAIIYLMFLTTYTLVLLYLSLYLLKRLVEFKDFEPSGLMYPEAGIGLTATPTSEDSYPLIWYKIGEKDDFQKYVEAIDKVLMANIKIRDLGILGPCGIPPYGYGDSPCIIIKVNKHFYWSGKPLQLNSTAMELVPPEVQKWMRMDNNRLWLQCSGYHSYDKEHIGIIKYYPDPPGLDPALFPLDQEGKSPFMAVQISNFTVGISLSIECNLWYENGPSSVEFVLYVAPDDSISFVGQTGYNI